MDIATILGLVAAFGVIGFAMADNIGAFYDVRSVAIVIGGSIFVVLARSSLKEFLGALGVMGKVFSRKIDDPVDLTKQLVELATIARKDGMIALEAANPAYETRILHDHQVKVQGRLVGLIRTY